MTDGVAELRALDASWSRVRTGAALFTLGHFLARRRPRAAVASGAAVGAALGAVNLVSRRARRTDDEEEARRLGLVQVAADAALASAVVWAYAPDERAAAWGVLFPPVLEGALRDELRGARRVWAALSASYVARDLWAARRYRRPFHAEAVAYKLGLVLVAGLTLGERVRELNQAKASLAELASTDELTGLPNRRRLDDRLAHALTRRPRPDEGLAVLVLDVDRLKEVNDTRGHAAGDDLLRAVADRIRTSVRPEDTVARVGGDEFVVLLERANRHDALAVAERVRQSATDVDASVSVGLAWVDDASVGAADLVQAADAAMYAAKRAGGDRVRSA